MARFFWYFLFAAASFLLAIGKATWNSTPLSPGERLFWFVAFLLLVFFYINPIEDISTRLRLNRNLRIMERERAALEKANNKVNAKRLREWKVDGFQPLTPSEYRMQVFVPPQTGAFSLADPKQFDYALEYDRVYERLLQLPVKQAKELYQGYLFRLQSIEPFVIPPATRFAGTWVIAPPGRGKTNLLHNLIAEDRARGTVVLMDSKGDLINAYRGLPDVVVIEPSTVEINPLQLGSSTRTLDFLEYIFSALLETKLTPKQTTLFRCVLALMLKIPNATVETFRKVLVHGWKEYEANVMQLDESNRDFFFVEGRKSEFDGGQYNETKQEVLQRLRLLVSNDYLKQIFTASQSNTDFFALLDSRKTVIIDNSKDELGENGAEFFGRFFVAMVWMAAVSRSKLRPDQKVPVYFYIDECHTVIKRDTKIVTILDECRSQKIALILAHQRIGQINPEVIDALNNCAIRLANSDDDAEALAKRFRVDAAALRLPIGQFSCFVRDKTPQAVTINVPLFDMSQFPPPPSRSPHEPAPSPPERPTVHAQPRTVPTDEVDDF